MGIKRKLKDPEINNFCGQIKTKETLSKGIYMCSHLTEWIWS